MEEEKKPVSIEDRWMDIFGSAGSVNGEEEMLRIAAKYASQLNARQIKAVLYLENLVHDLPPNVANRVYAMIKRWLELKMNNNSDIFIMKLFEYISLRKFFNENTFKVDIQK